VTVGAPEILSLSRDIDRLEGGAEVVISGKNFAPESLVILGDTIVTNAVVETATRIRLIVPSQNAPGKRTLSVLTRGGVVQREFKITSKPFDQLGTNEITTIAGGIPFLGDGGIASNGVFAGPQGVTIDGDGNIYILDTANSRIRKIDTAGVITTVAGNGTSAFSGDNGPAVGASLNVPRGLTLDGSGNLIIADAANFRVRKVNLNTGIITTIAGTGVDAFSGDNGPAINAALSQPFGVATDAAGNVFITDPGNDNVRRIDARTGIITTFAGNNSSSGPLGDGGPANKATLDIPTGITVDPSGNVFIYESNRSLIRRVDTKGIITTFAGNGTFGFSGDGGPAKNASLNTFISGTLSANQKGELFIVDTGNDRIRKIDARGIITTVAGNGTGGFGGDGGPATSASINLGLFSGMAIDGAGNMIICDSTNGRIRRVNLDGIINSIAGKDGINGDGGPAVEATISTPFKIIFDKTGNLLATDLGGRIRKIDLNTGIITSVAGSAALSGGDGGPALSAGFRLPTDIAIDNAGNLFIADPGNNRIRRVDAATGIITTFAGNGCDPFTQKCPFMDGAKATDTSVNFGQGLGIDKAGNVYISDGLFGIIMRVDPATGIIRRIAGDGTQFGFGGDGGPALRAIFRTPEDIAIDDAGNIFIADSGNSRIRRIDAKTGIITTVAGNGGFGFSGDGGLATSASLNRPTGLSFDNSGNLLIADTNNHVVRRVDSNGIITTIAGSAIAGYSGDGGSALSAKVNKPFGMIVNAAGDLFIATGFNDAIRAVKAMGSSQNQSDFSLVVNPAVRNVAAGATATYSINVQPINGFAQPVNLSVAFSSNDANGKLIASLSNATVTPGGNATLNVSVAPNTEPASFNVVITGTSGQIVKTQTVVVNVVAQPSVTITGARFVKPNLTISGSGFGTAGARVTVNGQDISSTITSQNDGSIILKGNKKKLAIKKGANQVTVTAGGATSNTFVFNFLSN
jgi:sugar lactone lactonase YvrE